VADQLRVSVLAGALALLSVAPTASAQDASARRLTLSQVVAEALANHPAVRAAGADERAAAARVDEARMRQLPDLGVSAQVNRSTGNTAPGTFFPTPGFPLISGAPRGKTFDSGVLQSGACLFASWDILSLARQAANIDAALATRSEANATVNLQRLEVAYRAADAFLVLLEADEGVRSAQATVERDQTLATVTRTLVGQNLRPGADAARAEAELAAAQTLLARAEQARGVRRAELAEAMGSAGQNVEAIAGGLLEPVDHPQAPAANPPPTHPRLLQSEAAITRAAEVERGVGLEYLPRVDAVAAIWVRGSGYFGSPADGLAPDIPNWAAGITASWSFLNIPTIRARARSASASHAAAVARRDQTYLAVAGQLSSGRAILDGATKVSTQTPIALAAARAAEQQAVARYRTGLTSVVDVAETERILAQAEIDDGVARLEVRRAMLLLARAAGDLGPFLAQSSAGGGG
jgi:outer membrane protein TolC